MLTNRFRDARLLTRFSRATLKDHPRLGMAATAGSQYTCAKRKRSVVEAECTKRAKSMTGMVVMQLI